MNHEFRLMIQKYIEQRLEGERMNALRNLLQAITFLQLFLKFERSKGSFLLKQKFINTNNKKGLLQRRKAKLWKAKI